MGLSSNSIIHFTNSFEALKGILENNFKLNFCSEKIKFTDSERTLKIPMVSFCDIPFSEMKNHISSYGYYGIGLTKEWAQKQKLNPVLYIEENSNLSQSFEFLYKNNINGKGVDFENWEDHNKNTLDIIRYIKSYQGDLYRKDQETVKEYRFSDEREWRFVPKITENFPLAIPIVYFESIEYKDKVDEFKQQIQSKSLSFTPNDIKYLIIQDDSEIIPLIQHLGTVKGKTYTYEDVQRLTTRIITSEQIFTDF